MNIKNESAAITMPNMRIHVTGWITTRTHNCNVRPRQKWLSLERTWSKTLINLTYLNTFFEQRVWFKFVTIYARCCIRCGAGAESAIVRHQPSGITITMTSDWTRWRLKSPASRLFTQAFIRVQITENIKAPRHWPLCGEFTGDRRIPRTKGQ